MLSWGAAGAGCGTFAGPCWTCAAPGSWDESNHTANNPNVSTRYCRFQSTRLFIGGMSRDYIRYPVVSGSRYFVAPLWAGAVFRPGGSPGLSPALPGRLTFL